MAAAAILKQEQSMNPDIQARRKRLAKLILCPGIAPPTDNGLDAKPLVPTTHRFHRCQPHAKCPNLTGWYLELAPDDVDTLMKVHKGVTCLYFFKFGKDPHFTPADVNKTNEIGVFYNPIKLAAQWLLSIERFLLNGKTVLVNSNGGIMPMDGVKILETVESDNLHWDDRFDDEIITISRWPLAKHYYLASSKGRVFIPEKHNSYNEAQQEALRYVPADRIKTKECTGALPPE
jgi:hypothetical protein